MTRVYRQRCRHRPGNSQYPRAFAHRAIIDAASDHNRRVAQAVALALGHPPDVADFGLLDSAVARPQSTVYGIDAYPSLPAKAAALLLSLARNRALVDGDKRTAWAAAWTFLHINGIELAPAFDVDAAEAFMYDVAEHGGLSVSDIAVTLATFAG